jgi:hypothetical protein
VPATRDDGPQAGTYNPSTIPSRAAAPDGARNEIQSTARRKLAAWLEHAAKLQAFRAARQHGVTVSRYVWSESESWILESLFSKADAHLLESDSSGPLVHCAYEKRYQVVLGSHTSRVAGR